MKVMITQPRYLPSMEYIGRIGNVDRVVLLDQTILNDRDFENRTRVKCRETDKWLTIPVSKGEKIADTRITGEFKNDHKNKIFEYYGKKFDMYDKLCASDSTSYIEFMLMHYEAMAKYLGKKVEIMRRSDLIQGDLTGKEEIKAILEKCHATEYLTGSNCTKYGVTEEYLFDIGVKLKIVDFEKQRELFQSLHGIDVTYSFVDTIMK